MNRPRGRTKGFVMPVDHRTKIANTKILNRLIDCAEGNLDLTKVQASVGLGLLKKVFPDLQSVAHSGDSENPIAHVHEIRRVIVDPKPHPDNSDSAGISTAPAASQT